MDSDRPRRHSRDRLVAAAVVLVVVLTLLMSGGSTATDRWIALLADTAVTVFVSVWALRRTRAQRRRYDDELAAWAAERAAAAERLRLADELHDLVSHGLGLITVRAAATRRMTGAQAETERIGALTDIEHAARRTTTELRRMLAVLHTPHHAPLRPTDTLDELPAIIGAANTAGLATTLETVEPLEVSPGIQPTVCAIVREALNNALRHAGPTRAHVTIRRQGDAVLVDVDNAGPADHWQANPGAGHGLAALRERVTALGGTIRAQPGSHGFHLTATIPDRSAP